MLLVSICVCVYVYVCVCVYIYIYISVFVEGFRRWRGTFWLLNESLIFKGPEA